MVHITHTLYLRSYNKQSRVSSNKVPPTLSTEAYAIASVSLGHFISYMDLTLAMKVSLSLSHAYKRTPISAFGIPMRRGRVGRRGNLCENITTKIASDFFPSVNK